MAQFVRKRKHGLQIVRMVQQQIGRCTVTAPGIGAGAFSATLPDVDPAIRKGVTEDIAIGLSEGLQSALDQPFRLFPRDHLNRLRHQRVHDVIHGDLFHAHHIGTQFEVAVKGRQVLVNGIHQIIVHRNGDIVAGKSHFPCRGVIPQFCLKNTGLHSTVKNGRISIDEGFVGIVAGVIRRFADSTVGIFQKMCVVPVGDLDLAAFAVRDLREAHIRIVQSAENVIGRSKCIFRHTEDPFFGSGKGMFALAFGLIQCALVKRQFRCRPERLKRFPGDRHQLRIKPGGLSGDLCSFGIDPVPTGGIDRVGGIFIPFQAGIDPDFLAEKSQFIRSPEGIPQHGRRFRKTPLESKKRRQQVIQFCKIFLPIFCTCVKCCQIPAIFFVQFRTVFYCHFHKIIPHCSKIYTSR